MYVHNQSLSLSFSHTHTHACTHARTHAHTHTCFTCLLYMYRRWLVNLEPGARMREWRGGRRSSLQRRATWYMTHKKPLKRRRHTTERSVEKLKKF